MTDTRLDKFVSNQTLLSRNDARKAIFTGRVKVNGETVTKIDFKIDTKNDSITLDGEDVVFEKYVYLIMNKPKGILSATTDKNAKTVVDISFLI